MKRRALILGVSGQDGAYLARLLADKGYDVHGTSRDAETNPFRGLERLGVRDEVRTHSVSLHDFHGLLNVVSRVEPEEIYNLAGQSSVGLSFDQPLETFESIAVGVIQLLEVVRFLGASTRVYNACSSECFGDVPAGVRCRESTPFAPRSPYAAAKASAFWLTRNYREAYDLHCCSGILFNHESPLRPERFVTRKIVVAAVRIAAGSSERLRLGNVEVSRDWGYAPEYVDAMWRMLQQESADDYVVASGESHSLAAFVERVFSALGLDWRDHVDHDAGLLRPSDILASTGDPTKAERELGWRAETRFDALVERLVAAERQAHGVLPD